MTADDVVRQIEEIVGLSGGRGGSPDDTQLLSDLALDSLSVLELVLRIEDAVGHEISFEFLSSLSTVGEVRAWLVRQCEP